MTSKTKDDRITDYRSIVGRRHRGDRCRRIDHRNGGCPRGRRSCCRGRARVRTRPGADARPKKARAAMEDAEFIAQRLETLLPRLHDKHEDRCADEHAAVWCDEFARLEQERDALADDLRQVYTEAAQRIVDVLARIAPLDRQILKHGVRAPEGLRERIQSVELAARSIDAIGHNQYSVVRDLVLPDFDDPTKKFGHWSSQPRNGPPLRACRGTRAL